MSLSLSVNNTVVGNLVRWVKDTPAEDALTRSQFALVMALCVEDNTYPSFSPVFGDYVNDSINVSDIVDFILWGAWIETRQITTALLRAACALLENYKAKILHLWPTAKAGDIAYRAIMFMMNMKGPEIIGDQLKYRLAMSSISSISDELLGPVDNTTLSMFSKTLPNVFDFFATELYIPHLLPRPKLYQQDTVIEIINKDDAPVDTDIAELHIQIWGTDAYIEPFSDTLRLISVVSKAGVHAHVHMKDVYVAGMAISGLMASCQMISTAVQSGNIEAGHTHIMAYVDCVRKGEVDKELQRLRDQEQSALPSHSGNTAQAGSPQGIGINNKCETVSTAPVDVLRTQGQQHSQQNQPEALWN